MSLINFRVAVKVFDSLPLSGGYYIRQYKICLKDFDKILSNKYQVMIRKLLKGQFLQKQFRKQLISIG